MSITQDLEMRGYQLCKSQMMPRDKRLSITQDEVRATNDTQRKESEPQIIPKNELLSTTLDGVRANSDS